MAASRTCGSGYSREIWSSTSWSSIRSTAATRASKCSEWRDSLKAGFDGFVAFRSKTALVDHFIRKYGAQVIRGNQLMFDAGASIRLVEEHLGENYGDG